MSEIKQVWGIIKNYQCADLKMVQDPALAVFQHQQAIIDSLKAQLNNMEQCYIGKKKECEDQQKENSEMQEMMLRDGALATRAQKERNEWQEVVKSQQKTIENLTNQKEVVNITVDDSNHFEISEKVEKAIKRGARLTRHQIDLRGTNA